MGPPVPEAMNRDEPAPAPSTKAGFCARVCCPFLGPVSGPGVRYKRQERVFYDSAFARRTCLGKCHYCLACPGWSKLTTMRVAYSRWDLIPCTAVPGACCTICCDCGGSEADWLPPDPKVMKTPTSDEVGGCLLPCGRTLDTFDSDIIVDASAHQTCCQICRNEGGASCSVHFP